MYSSHGEVCVESVFGVGIDSTPQLYCGMPPLHVQFNEYVH